MVIDYRQPGLYLVSGDSVKNFSVLESLNMGTAGANPPIRTLAAEVEWVFIALQKRRQMVAQIEVNWLLNGQPSDDAPPWMNTTTLQRIDQAIQLYAKAYMHKRRTRGGGVDALGWLDPTTVTPHETGIKSIYDGYATYVRNSDAGAIFVPREDLLIFEMLGTAELAPDLSAGGATRLAAGILRALSKTADTIFDNNAGLPLMLVKVPAGVVPEERDKLADRFQRLFNRNKGVTGELSTVGVPEGVEVVPLSLKPADLAMDTLAQPRITAILAAHDVPKSMVMGDTANFATAEAERQNFALSIGYRLKHLADIINRDPDIQKMGWEMDVQPEKSAVSVETEERRANIWSIYVDRMVDPMAAFNLAGIDVPEDMQIVQVERAAPEPAPAPATTGQREEEVRRLKTFVRAGKHEKRPFHSDILTPEEIELYTFEEVGFPNDTPFFP